MKKKVKINIHIKKILLNFLLKYLSPSNKLVIYLSQDLDKLISKSQKHIYFKYIRKNFHGNPFKNAA